MKINIVKLTFIALVFFQLSCAEKYPTNSKQSSEDYIVVLEDITKLANIVTNFSIDPSGGGPSLSEYSYITYNEETGLNADNVEEFEFKDDKNFINFRFKYFAMDGRTPITQTDAVNGSEYIVTNTFTSRNDTTESYIYSSSIVTNIDSYLQIPIGDGIWYIPKADTESWGAGETKYLYKSFVLKTDSSISRTTQEGDIFTTREFSFMNGKYKFILEESLIIAELGNDLTFSNERVSGDIYDQNTYKVGKFILNHDNTVIIEDRDGNIIQTAGN